MIETHLTFDKKFFGPDTSSSITFDELNEITKFNREFYEIKKGKVRKDKLTSQQKTMRKFFCKSIMVKNDLKKNQKISIKDLKFVKPMLGISALDAEKIFKKKLTKNLKQGTFIKWSDFK